MQSYGKNFARIYNARWGGFAMHAAPLIRNFYESTSFGQDVNKTVLDLCCGTGQLAIHFLENGYKVIGIDLSEHMLGFARENASQYIQSGQAKFIKDDASSFTLRERFGLVVSTYDALNHLKDEEMLRNCFQCAHAVCEGFLIFDLNTRSGLRQWNNIHVDEGSDDALIVTRGIFDGENNTAWTRIDGFLRTENGLYERFEETAFNTVFELERVKTLLFEVGWKDIYFASLQDLKTPLPEPEQESRVFIVASK